MLPSAVPFRFRLRLAAWLAGTLLLAGCGDSGDSALSNNNPGANDVNVVAAFGDSITQGTQCSCVPYPARLTGLIGKVVVNAGIHGSMAHDNVGRTQNVIDRNHPAFMLILYGVNDGIHGDGTGGTVVAIGQMVEICKNNHVVPVLATYPIPFGPHSFVTHTTRVLNRGIRQLAHDAGVRCVDLEKEFALPDESSADPALMEADGLHPNDAGTQIMALAFADLF